MVIVKMADSVTIPIVLWMSGVMIIMMVLTMTRTTAMPTTTTATATSTICDDEAEDNSFAARIVNDGCEKEKYCK